MRSERRSGALQPKIQRNGFFWTRRPRDSPAEWDVCIPDRNRVVDSGGLQLEQFMMRDFRRSTRCCWSLPREIAERPVLVTFNGKTFDWPFARKSLPDDAGAYGCRSSRRTGFATSGTSRVEAAARFGAAVELERHVLDAPRLGWHREDDVPSSLTRNFIFDYLRGRSALPLAGVVRHNGMDLRGLAACSENSIPCWIASSRKKQKDWTVWIVTIPGAPRRRPQG